MSNRQFNRYFRAIQRSLGESEICKVLATIYKEDIRANFLRQTEDQRKSILCYLKEIIPKYFNGRKELAYINISSVLLDIFCLDYNVMGGKLQPSPSSFPTEINERLLNVYKRVVRFFANRELPKRCINALRLYLPDAKANLNHIEDCDNKDPCIESRFFLAAILRAIERLGREETGYIWNIIFQDHIPEKALLVYINLLLMISKRLSWWVFKGDELIEFARRFSKTAQEWSNADCYRMSSAIYYTRGKYLIECLVDREGDMHIRERGVILFKMRKVFIDMWYSVVLRIIGKYFCNDLVNVIGSFLYLQE